MPGAPRQIEDDDGAGVAKDEKTAVEWLRKAADQGQKSAEKALREMRAQGRGGL